MNSFVEILLYIILSILILLLYRDFKRSVRKEGGKKSKENKYITYSIIIFLVLISIFFVPFNFWVLEPHVENYLLLILLKVIHVIIFIFSSILVYKLELGDTGKNNPLIVKSLLFLLLNVIFILILNYFIANSLNNVQLADNNITYFSIILTILVAVLTFKNS